MIRYPAISPSNWEQMVKICSEVQELSVPRSFYPANRGKPKRQQLHAFSDASDLASCTAIYIRTEPTHGGVFVAFVSGSTRVLPKSTTVKGQLSIPRAELLAAEDLALRVHDTENEIDIPNLEPTQFYTTVRLFSPA